MSCKTAWIAAVCRRMPIKNAYRKPKSANRPPLFVARTVPHFGSPDSVFDSAVGDTQGRYRDGVKNGFSAKYRAQKMGGISRYLCKFKGAKRAQIESVESVESEVI